MDSLSDFQKGFIYDLPNKYPNDPIRQTEYCIKIIRVYEALKDVNEEDLPAIQEYVEQISKKGG